MKISYLKICFDPIPDYGRKITAFSAYARAFFRELCVKIAKLVTK